MFYALILLIPMHIAAAAYSESHAKLTIPKDTFLSIMDKGPESTIEFILAQRGPSNRKIVIYDRVNLYNPEYVLSGFEELSPLLFALRNNHFKTAWAIMRIFPDYIHIKDSRANTALHYFCRFRSMQPEEEITPLDRSIITALKPLINTPNMELGPFPWQAYPVAFAFRNLPLLIALSQQGATINRHTITQSSGCLWPDLNTFILCDLLEGKQISQDAADYPIVKQLKRMIKQEKTALDADAKNKKPSLTMTLRDREEGLVLHKSPFDLFFGH